MDLSLRSTHTQQEALPTSKGSIPSSPCTSPIIFQTLHSSEKWDLVPQAVTWEVPTSKLLLSPLTHYSAGCNHDHSALQRKRFSYTCTGKSRCSPIYRYQGPLCQCLLGQATMEFHTVNQSLKRGHPHLTYKATKKMLPNAHRDKRT